MRTFLLAGVAIAALALPATAIAQDKSAQPPVDTDDKSTIESGETPGSSSDASPDSQAASGLADIVVTAQRKVETAQRAAIAIDVVGGNDLAGNGITQINRLSELVPALTIQQIGPSTSSFIRGVGNFSVSINSDPAVAFNIDGVYVGRLTATSGTFYDLDRVEVLKGPQGTLYGRNATAGAINVIPTQPKLGEFSGYVTASYGNYNSIIAEGAINAPLGENGALRVSGTVTNRDGYLNDGTSDDKTQALRFQMKSELTPDLTVRVAADYTHLGGKGNGYTYINTHIFNPVTSQFVVTPTNFARSEGLLSPLSQAFFQRLGAGVGGTVRTTRNPFPQLFQNSNFYGAHADIIWDTGIGVLTVIPAMRFDKVRNLNPSGGFPILNDQRDFQYSLEARFAGAAGIVDYMVGAFYYNEEVRLRSASRTFGTNTNFTQPTVQTTESYAPFARVTANLTDALRLVGGVRYTQDSKNLTARTTTIAVACAIAPPTRCPTAVLPGDAVLRPELLPFAIPAATGTIPGPVPGQLIIRSDLPPFDRSLKNEKVTYRAAVEFDVAPASLLYASLETGFRSGGLTTLVGFETYEPEFITAYTLGSKNRFFDNRVQLNIEAFYWKYRNQQVAHPGLDRGTPPRPGSITENIGNSVIKGVEVSGRVLVTPTTTLSADVQYLDTKSKSFSYQTPAALRPRTNCVTTAVAGSIPPLVNIDCSGLPSFNSPKWTMNLAARQTVPLGEYELAFGADTQYKTRRYMGFEYQPEQLQGSSWTSNANISFGPADSQWSISAFVRNIENNRLYGAPFAFANVLIAYTTPPRTYGARANVKF